MSRARRVLQGSRLLCSAKSVLFSAETSSAAWLRQFDGSWPEGGNPLKFQSLLHTHSATVYQKILQVKQKSALHQS